MCTGAEAAAVAQMAASQSGGGQFGPTAPSPVVGGAVPSFGGGAGLGGFGGAQPPPSLQQITGPLNSQQAEVAPKADAMYGQPSDVMGPPTAEDDPLSKQNSAQGLGGFFGNLDQNLQSPSKTIGMGLLSQVDPRLGAAGLLAGGLFGKNKVF